MPVINKSTNHHDICITMVTAEVKKIQISHLYKFHNVNNNSNSG